jgi:hypothetical protein
MAKNVSSIISDIILKVRCEKGVSFLYVKIEQLFEGGFVKILDYPRESVCMVYIERLCSIFIIGKFGIF